MIEITFFVEYIFIFYKNHDHLSSIIVMNSLEISVTKEIQYMNFFVCDTIYIDNSFNNKIGILTFNRDIFWKME